MVWEILLSEALEYEYNTCFTDDSYVFRVKAIDTSFIAGTLHEVLLIPTAVNALHPYNHVIWANWEHGGCWSCLTTKKSQLTAHNASVNVIKSIIADGAPVSVHENLHTAFSLWVTIHQSNSCQEIPKACIKASVNCSFCLDNGLTVCAIAICVLRLLPFQGKLRNQVIDPIYSHSHSDRVQPFAVSRIHCRVTWRSRHTVGLPDLHDARIRMRPHAGCLTRALIYWKVQQEVRYGWNGQITHHDCLLVHSSKLGVTWIWSRAISPFAPSPTSPWNKICKLDINTGC